MRILFLGDTVGRSGREGAAAALPGLRKTLGIDLAIVNAENASHGFGLAPDMAAALFAAGADVLTLGNHAWDRKEIIPYIAQQPRLIRPLNFPPGTPGAGFVVVEVPGGRRALVLNAMGRLFMDPLDCPFRGTTDILSRYRLGGTVKRDRGRLPCRGDQREAVLCACFSTASCRWSSARTRTCRRRTTRCCRAAPPTSPMRGMCGDYDSVIGMAKEGAAARFVRKMPGERLAPAEGPATICGLFVETDDSTGLALRAEPVRVGGRLSQVMPA